MVRMDFIEIIYSDGLEQVLFVSPSDKIFCIENAFNYDYEGVNDVSSK